MLPNASLAAKEVPKTPSKKLNSDFEAKMGGEATFFDDFMECAR